MTTPDRQTLTLALFEVASAHHRPTGITLEYPPTRVDLVVEISHADQACNPAKDGREQSQPECISIPAVPCDMPSTGEDETRPRGRMIEYGPGCSGRVTVDPPGHEDGEHSVAPGDGPPDDFGVVCRAGYDGNAPLKCLKFRHTLLPADASYLIPAVERVLHHIPAEFSGAAHDANFQCAIPRILEKAAIHLNDVSDGPLKTHSAPHMPNPAQG